MKICPACTARIDNDLVLFQHGRPGSTKRLYARVCQYAKKSGCINYSYSQDDLSWDDRWIPPEDHPLAEEL